MRPANKPLQTDEAAAASSGVTSSGRVGDGFAAERQTVDGQVNMEIANIVSAVLAGGLAGQITSVLLTQRLQGRREKDAWLRDARLHAFTELLENTSSYATRREFETWPTEIRVLCQKALLLCPGGEAPRPLADAMQRSFVLALHRKQDRVKDAKKWRDAFRSTTSILRREMAILIHGSGQSASSFDSSDDKDQFEEDAGASVGRATTPAIAAVEQAVAADSASPLR